MLDTHMIYLLNILDDGPGGGDDAAEGGRSEEDHGPGREHCSRPSAGGRPRTKTAAGSVQLLQLEETRGRGGDERMSRKRGGVPLYHLPK